MQHHFDVEIAKQYGMVAQMSRPLAEVTQFVRPSFAKAVKAAQPQALALQPEVPRLEPPRWTMTKLSRFNISLSPGNRAFLLP